MRLLVCLSPPLVHMALSLSKQQFVGLRHHGWTELVADDSVVIGLYSLSARAQTVGAAGLTGSFTGSLGSCVVALVTAARPFLSQAAGLLSQGEQDRCRR